MTNKKKIRNPKTNLFARLIGVQGSKVRLKPAKKTVVLKDVPDDVAHIVSECVFEALHQLGMKAEYEEISPPKEGKATLTYKGIT